MGPENACCRVQSDPVTIEEKELLGTDVHPDLLTSLEREGGRRADHTLLAGREQDVHIGPRAERFPKAYPAREHALTRLCRRLEQKVMRADPHFDRLVIGAAGGQGPRHLDISNDSRRGSKDTRNRSRTSRDR